MHLWLASSAQLFCCIGVNLLQTCELVTEGLDGMEDDYRATAIVDRVRKGDEAIYSSAQVRQHLGFAD